jgi:hypothetical protein
VDTTSRSYQVFNLIGSATLAADAAATGQWGFLLLEGAWAVMSLAGLMRSFMGRPARLAHDHDPPALAAHSIYSSSHPLLRIGQLNAEGP